MILKQTDPRVKTTGRKSHDPFKCHVEHRVTGAEGHRQTEKGSRGMKGVGSVLFTLVFPSRSDAGVWRPAWRLSRCGLQHQDHYRGKQAAG